MVLNDGEVNMKILVLSSNTNSLIQFRLDMMKSFQSRGYTVVAAGDAPEEKWSDYFSAMGIRYRQIFVQRNGMNPKNDLKTLSSIKKLLQEERPDKIFAYQAKSIVYGGAAAKQLRIKEFYPLIAGVGSIFVSKGIKIKIVRAILSLQYRHAMNKAPIVFFQNNDDVELFLKKKIVKRSQVCVINGSGVNLDIFTPMPIPEQTAFLSVSRLIKDKGVREYLSAARIVKERYPHTRFMLVGPFDSNPSAIKPEELKPYIDDNVIEYFGEQRDVRPYLGQCSVFVLPSYREGVPKTVLEAMASQRAIITTDAPGCRDTVIDGENGYLVPVGDAVALADKMIELLNSPDQIAVMAKKGRRIAEEKYDVNKINKNICDAMKM